jgi:4-amino-4-deoxy-L-arabinose transferase-like glycosyltransferase
VGLLPPLLSIVVFLLITRDRDGLRRLRVGRGLLVWAGVVLLWLAPAVAIEGRAYFDYLIFGQTVNRYVAPIGHYRPFYYYLTVIPSDFFPFVSLLPMALVALLGRGSPLDRESRCRLWLPLCWAAVTVLFFSVSAGKRSVYIVAIYAPLALLLAAGCEVLRRQPRFARGWWLASAAPVALLGVLFPVAVPIAAREEPEIVAVLGADILRLAWIVVAPMSLGFVLALLPAWQRRARGILLCWALGTAAGATLAVALILPRLDATKSAKPLAEQLLSLARPGEPYGLYPLLEAAFLFYTRQPAVQLCTPEQILRFAEGEGRRWLLIERRELSEIADRLPMVEVARDADWQDGFVLLTTPPWPRPPGEPVSGDTREATRRANAELHATTVENPCTGGLSLEQQK